MRPIDVPTLVQEARELVAQQSRQIRIMMGGLVGSLGLMLAAGAAGHEAVAAASVGLLISWTIGNVIWIARKEQDTLLAHNVLKTYEERKLIKDLEAVEVVELSPEDPRWSALSKLLSRIDAMGATDEVTTLVKAVEDRLRHLLEDIAVVTEAERADLELGGESDSSRQQKLRGARLTKEAIADKLINTVRDLHVELAVRDDIAADPILQQLQSLVMQVEAEAEVDDVVSMDNERRRLQRAAQAQKIGQ